MMRARVGLLPLYLELYDRVLPHARGPLEAFRDTIVSELTARGLGVVPAPVCRVRPEFGAAMKSFEDSGVSAIITLHLAYSPSLESVDALAGTNLPVVVLDTTPDEFFGPMQDPALLMNNHGVHGVQDLCNLLRRRGKPFIIEAGHWRTSDVLDRVCAHVKSGSDYRPEAPARKSHPGAEHGGTTERAGCPAIIASPPLKRAVPEKQGGAKQGHEFRQSVLDNAGRLAAAMRNARVGRIGRPFRGMGDFQVDDADLRSAIGMEVVPVTFETLCAMLPAADHPAAQREVARDHETFAASPDLDAAAHIASILSSLAVRAWVERERLTAFTINFDDVGKDSRLPAMPFLEASKGMARGIGYAGEGDVLTAAFVGALASVFPETTFTEIFCPDWAGETLFLSHMAEMNIALCAGKPTLLVKPMPWMELDRPTIAVGRFKGGDAMFVDLAPAPDDKFTLIIAPVRVVDVNEDRMDGMVRGWIRPAVPISKFLEAYSRAGGTHHAALVYQPVANRIRHLAESFAGFADAMGWELVEIH